MAKIRVEDVVVYRPAYLKYIGAFTGEMANRTGKVAEIRDNLAVVQWYDVWPIKSSILSANLMVVQRPGGINAQPTPRAF